MVAVLTMLANSRGLLGPLVVLGGVGASDGPQQWGNLGACWPWQGSPPLYNTLARSNVYLGSWYVVVAPQLLARWCRAAPRLASPPLQPAGYAVGVEACPALRLCLLSCPTSPKTTSSQLMRGPAADAVFLPPQELWGTCIWCRDNVSLAYLTWHATVWQECNLWATLLRHLRSPLTTNDMLRALLTLTLDHL